MIVIGKTIPLKMRIAAFLAIGFLCFNMAVGEARYAEQDSVVLKGTAKQEYMAKRMMEMRHPDTSTKAAKQFSLPQGWEHEKFSLDELKMERLQNPNAHNSQGAILQLHGGAYKFGLVDWYRELAVKQALAADAKEIYMTDYRLAPQYTYPAALEDAVKAYKYLLNYYQPENIIIMGDSAGGNLSLALSLYLKEHELPQPAMLVLASPWATMESNLPARKYNYERDVILGKTNPSIDEIFHPGYAGTFALDDVRLSPLHADLRGLPPMLVQVGGYELFLDDGIELMKKAVADNVDITLTVYPEMPHDFAVVLPEMQESIDSLQEIRDFVARHIHVTMLK